MALDHTSKAIAKEAWFQVVNSIISEYPPSGMSVQHYYARPESGLQYLDIYGYKLGSELIQARMRCGMDSQMVRANVHDKEQKITHIQDSSNKHSEVVQADENQQVIEYIQDPMRSCIHYEAVQANKDIKQLGIEHIQDRMRSPLLYEVVQENKDENQQGIEHIQHPMRSPVAYEVAQAYKDENQQGIEHIQDPMRSVKLYEIVQTDKDENQQVIEHIQDPMRSATHYEDVQAKIEYVQDSMRFDMQNEVLQPNEENEVEKQQVVESYPAKTLSMLYELLELVENGDLPGEEQSTPRSEVLEFINELHNYGVDTLRSEAEKKLEEANLKYEDIEKDPAEQFMKQFIEVLLRVLNNQTCQRTICKIIGKTESYRGSCKHCEVVVQANEGEKQQAIEHILDRMRLTVHYKVVQPFKDENQQGMENILAKGLSMLLELWKLVRNGDLSGQEQSTPRSEVLQLIKHLHDDGIHTTRSELEEVRNVIYELYETYDDIEEDTTINHLKKYLTLMSIICSEEMSQRTICKLRGKVEGNQVYCKHCEVVQNDPGNQLAQAKEISIMFNEVLELVENGDLHGGEKPNLRFKVLQLIKVLHHYGVDTIRSAVKEELEDVNQKNVNLEKDSAIGYRKKSLEAMLRICDTETCQKTFYEIIGTTESTGVLYT